jgi:16S rRNA (uracil1498-N3)-methyltransferase
VRRIEVGATLSCRTADGRLAAFEVTRIDADSLTLTPVGPESPENTGPFPRPRVVLYQCIPKGKKLDQIVRQAVEAGVSRIVPVHSRHTVVRLEPQRSRARLERLRRIAREALQQSGNPAVVSIDEPTQLQDIQLESATTGLLLHEKPVLRALESAEQTGYPAESSRLGPSGGATLHGRLARVRAGISLVVGPEGGLAPSEVDHLMARGFAPIYLGPFVLRVETAAVFALGAIMTSLLEREHWSPR